jgi:hypothetical protein
MFSPGFCNFDHNRHQFTGMTMSLNLPKSLPVAICALVLFAGAAPAESATGTSGLAFLKLGVGARANGLGYAYTSVVDDATAVFWNPAGLLRMRRAQVTVTHSEWLAGIRNDFAAFAFPGLGGVVGLSAYLNNIDGVERRTRPSDDPIGTVEANDLALGFSYARALPANLQAGITVKYLYEKISLESASGLAFDFGLNYRPLPAPLHLALVFQNVGSMSDLRNDAITLPATIRAGVSYLFRLRSGDLVLASDVVKVRGLDMRANVGTELRVKERLAVRAGYQTGFDNKGISVGFGLKLNRTFMDYGYTPFDADFGNTHRFSLALDL